MADESATFWEVLEGEISHLHAGSSLERTGISWPEYEHLLDQLDERSDLRVSYDRGRLEIVTTTQLHEMYSDLLLLIAYTAASYSGLPFESRGSTTFKSELLRQGAESDTCIYSANAHLIVAIPRRQIDLNIDPAPDIIVEVDITHSSSGKHSFYRRIGVPELWVYDGSELRILTVGANGYEPVPASTSFSILTAELLTRALELSRTEGQSGALRYLKDTLS